MPLEKRLAKLSNNMTIVSHLINDHGYGNGTCFSPKMVRQRITSLTILKLVWWA
jgi:hypothetical protein